MKSLLIMLCTLLFTFSAAADECEAGPTQYWAEPKVSSAQAQAILKNYDVERIVDQGVPVEPLTRALIFFHQYRQNIANKDFVTVVDMTKHSGSERFFRINLRNGDVQAHETSHGQGSDPSKTGFAKAFSNANNSHMTAIGYYLTDEIYSGKHGASLKLDGLSKSNSEARRRCIVIHGADYVGPGKTGRSHGCPALPQREVKDVMDDIKGRSLLYIWGGQQTVAAAAAG